MRTQKEIIERAIDRQPDDFLGFEWEQYLRALTAESMETLRGTLLEDDADLSGWEPDLVDNESVLKECKDYMSFAWGKANNCRGISANRSIMHYQAWLWLLGEDQFDALFDDYEFYGKPQLEKICTFLQIDPKQWDDNIRSNVEY